MDGTQFDNLARRLSATRSRRGVVATAIALLGGGVAAREAAAVPSVRRTVCRPYGAGCLRNSQCCSANCLTGRALPRRVRNRCGCAGGHDVCSNGCVDLQTDVAHCGDCDTACDVVNGESCCDGSCVDLMTDPDHCGACDATPCATQSGEICEAGVCLVPLCLTQDGKGVAATQC